MIESERNFMSGFVTIGQCSKCLRFLSWFHFSREIFVEFGREGECEESLIHQK